MAACSSRSTGTARGLELEGAGLDAAEFLQVSDQSLQPPGLVVQLRKVGLIRGQNAVHQRLQRTANHAQRSAQFVSHVADKLSAHGLGFLEPRRHLIERHRQPLQLIHLLRGERGQRYAFVVVTPGNSPAGGHHFPNRFNHAATDEQADHDRRRDRRHRRPDRAIRPRRPGSR